jgi:hypothetical protein
MDADDETEVPFDITPRPELRRALEKAGISLKGLEDLRDGVDFIPSDELRAELQRVAAEEEEDFGSDSETDSWAPHNSWGGATEAASDSQAEEPHPGEWQASRQRDPE